ncbi:MAG TPA: homoserine lactone transporter [Firmicutes bacterium]|jgi:threonine/homoserine/homoserine lactone efflux protein|nr:homoserine lactone transporter [Bacillota bacterium]
MPGIINYGLFVISGIILNITPGPDTFYVLGQSISQGKRAGILSLLGIESATLIHTMVVAFGLAVLFAKSALAFGILKYMGAAYLIYLGGRSIFGRSEVSFVKEHQAEKRLKIYLQGFFTSLFNPKVILFFLAFLPQFVSSRNSYGVFPFIILGGTFICTGTIWMLIITLFSAHVTQKLRGNITLANILNKATGILFVALGLNLLRVKANG